MAATEEEVKLLGHWASPYVISVVLALELKGIQYEFFQEDLDKKSELLLKSNPVHKKVPVLIHNGKPIAESKIIVEYIDEVWPQRSPLLPNSPFGRAQARFWADFVSTKIGDVVRFVRAKDEATQAAVNKEFIQSCQILEEALAKNEEEPYIAGKHMGFADVLLAPFAVWLPTMETELGLQMPSAQDWPRFHKVLDAIRAHPAGSVALPGPDKLSEFFHSMIAVWRPRT